MSSGSHVVKEREELVHIESNVQNSALAETLETKETSDEAAAGSINAADEVTGVKLALIVVGLCFSNILTGLVRWTGLTEP